MRNDTSKIWQEDSVAQGSIDSLCGKPTVFVRAATQDGLRSALLAGGLVAEPTAEGDGGLAVKTHDISLVGELAFRGGIPLHELRPLASDLEDLFFRLTSAPEHRNRNLGAPPSGTDLPPAPATAQDGGSI